MVPTVKSTKESILEFMESLLWKDFIDELNRLDATLSSEMMEVGEPRLDTDTDGSYMKVYPSTAETLIHLGDIKGRRKAILYFKSIPDIFIQTLEVEKDDSKR